MEPLDAYTLTVAGCDASTVVVLDLTESQAAFLKDVCRMVTDASQYQCMPIMELELENL